MTQKCNLRLNQQLPATGGGCWRVQSDAVEAVDGCLRAVAVCGPLRCPAAPRMLRESACACSEHLPPAASKLATASQAARQNTVTLAVTGTTKLLLEAPPAAPAAAVAAARLHTPPASMRYAAACQKPRCNQSVPVNAPTASLPAAPSAQTDRLPLTTARARCARPRRTLPRSPLACRAARRAPGS